MEIAQSVFGLYKFTDDESQRYELDGIMFRRTEDGSPIAVATTGSIMVAVTWDDDDSSVPFQAIVPTEACRQVYAYGEVDDCCVTIDEDPDYPNKCTLELCLDEIVVAFTSPILSGSFPEYQDKFESSPAAVVVKLKVSMLSDVLAMFADMKIDGIVIAVVNHEKAVTMTGTNSDGVSIAVALAPNYKVDGTATVLGWMPVVAKAKTWPLEWKALTDEHENEYLEAESPCLHECKPLFWRIDQLLEYNRIEWRYASDRGIDLGGRDCSGWPSRQEAMDGIQKIHDTIMQSREGAE